MAAGGGSRGSRGRQGGVSRQTWICLSANISPSLRWVKVVINSHTTGDMAPRVDPYSTNRSHSGSIGIYLHLKHISKYHSATPPHCN